MDPFAPKLDILPPAQRRLWSELAHVPNAFVLYGGTAIALHLGHRQSVDFDFFGDREFDVDALVQAVPFMADAEIIQRAPNTVTGVVDRGAPVRVSFFGVPKLVRLRPPCLAPDNALQVASLIDLAGTKLSVIQVRAEAKDYIDIDAMLRAGVIDLPSALAAGAAIYGRQFNPFVSLKALSYFEDGTVADLPDEIKARLVAAVRKVDLDRLPPLPGIT